MLVGHYRASSDANQVNRRVEATHCVHHHEMMQRPEINPELERSSSRGKSDCDGVDESVDVISSESGMKDVVGSWVKSAPSRQAK